MRTIPRKIVSCTLFLALLAMLLFWPSLEAQTAQHGVFLTWNGSAASYNIYRGTATGAETTLIANVTQTSYVDVLSGLSAGTTYFYVVRAVNSVGVESAVSNEVFGVIPNAPVAVTGLQAVVK